MAIRPFFQRCYKSCDAVIGKSKLAEQERKLRHEGSSQAEDDDPRRVGQQRVSSRGEESTMNVAIPKKREWAVIRVFVSSTFHDFKPEGDALHQTLFRKLERYCRTRRFQY